MPRGLMDKLRGARGLGLLAALALVALLALVLLRGGDARVGPGSTALEERLERMLSGVAGAGRVRVMVNQDSEGVVTGALIVAEELEDVGAYLSLQGAVTTLLQVEPARVEIIGKDGCFGGVQ